MTDIPWAGDADAASRYPHPVDIRAALLPEQHGDFDTAYTAALFTARDTLRLDALHNVLIVWRRMALLTQEDPDRQRQMLATVAEITATGQPRAGSVSWDELRVELGV